MKCLGSDHNPSTHSFVGSSDKTTMWTDKSLHRTVLYDF